jgi:hypothetical protein
MPQPQQAPVLDQYVGRRLLSIAGLQHTSGPRLWHLLLLGRRVG